VTETPRQRQVRETFAGWEHDRAVRIEEAVKVEHAQFACEQAYGHFLTAPLPDLGGRRRCIACEAIVDTPFGS